MYVKVNVSYVEIYIRTIRMCNNYFPPEEFEFDYRLVPEFQVAEDLT